MNRARVVPQRLIVSRARGIINVGDEIQVQRSSAIILFHMKLMCGPWEFSTSSHKKRNNFLAVHFSGENKKTLQREKLSWKTLQFPYCTLCAILCTSAENKTAMWAKCETISAWKSPASGEPPRERYLWPTFEAFSVFFLTWLQTLWTLCAQDLSESEWNFSDKVLNAILCHPHLHLFHVWSFMFSNFW